MTKSYKRIMAVEKAIDILEYLSNQKKPVPAPDIAQATGMTYGACMCHLATMEDHGFVRTMGEHFTLGLTIARYWAKIKSREEARLQETQNILTALETGEQLRGGE